MEIPPEVSSVKHSHPSTPPENSGGFLRDPRFSVISTAAGTSAIVSLLTLWIWTPVAPHVADSSGSVSVTYEQLDSERPQDGRADEEMPEAKEPEAGVIATRGDDAVLPVAHPTQEAPPGSTARSAARRPTADVEKDVAPASAAVGVSRIVINTEPAGATVTINGVGYGTTPLTIPYLPPGAKRIRVTKAGYQTEERFYGSDASRAPALRITLREIPRNATR